MCNTCTSMCIKLSLKKQHVNKIHFRVFGFMSCFVQIYMTNTADTKKLSGRVRDVEDKARQVTHETLPVNRQIFQLTTSSIMLRTINEQILYIIVTSSIRSQGEFKREQSTTLVFGCHQNHSTGPYGQWQERTRECQVMHDYRMTRSETRSERKRKSQGKSLCRGEQWMKRSQEPAWAQT